MTNSRRNRSRSHMRKRNSTRRMTKAFLEDDLRQQLDRSRSLNNELTSNPSRKNIQPTQPFCSSEGLHAGQTNFQMTITCAMLLPVGQTLTSTPGILGGNQIQGAPQHGSTPICQPGLETLGYYVTTPIPRMMTNPHSPIAQQQMPQLFHEQQPHLQPQGSNTEGVRLANRTQRLDRGEHKNHRQDDVIQRRSVFDRIRKNAKFRLGVRGNHDQQTSRRITKKRLKGRTTSGTEGLAGRVDYQEAWKSGSSV